MFQKQFLSLPVPGFDKTAIEAAIKAAELRTTGEIRVYVERRPVVDVMARAQRVFCELNMIATKDRAGVLFYVHLRQRELVLLGDVGINEKLGAEVWQRIRDAVLACFKRGEMTVGVVLGIMLAGEKLAGLFPCSGAPSLNELSDTVVEGSLP